MAGTTDTLGHVTASREQPRPQTADGQPVLARGDRYGGNIVALNPRRALADEGANFIITNPTVGTGVANSAAVSAFSDTNAYIWIHNNAPAGGKRIYLDYLRLLCTALGAAGQLAMHFAVIINPTARVLTTAANMTVHTPVNVNGGSSEGTVATVRVCSAAGVPDLDASNTLARRVARTSIPTGVAVVGDQYVLYFGRESPSPQKTGLTAARATDTARICGDAPPVIVGPGQSCTIHRWWVTETGTSTFEYEFSWFER